MVVQRGEVSRVPLLEDITELEVDNSISKPASTRIKEVILSVNSLTYLQEQFSNFLCMHAS